MKQPYRKIILVSVVLVLAVVVGVGIMWDFMRYKLPGVTLQEGPDVLLDSLQAGANRVQFYIDYGYDTAVIGFFVKDQTGRPRYFPMYCSTYRGLPPVELDVFLSDTEEQMWVLSSWMDKPLAYYRVGSDRCLTSYGEHAAIDTPMLQSGRSGSGDFPDMHPAHVKKVLTINHPPP